MSRCNHDLFLMSKYVLYALFVIKVAHECIVCSNCRKLDIYDRTVL